MNNNQMTTNDQQPALKSVNFGMYVNGRTTKQIINRVITDKKKLERYITAIVSAVSINPELSKCTFPSILTGSLLAESLGLAHSPQLGQYYLVPFKVKAKNGIPEHYDAQFIMGYKGLIQLAIRSGQYRKINVMEIKEGELVSYNPFDEDIELNPIQDVDKREKTPTAGYYAMFEYVNGFRKVLYWSKKQMLAHADKYSQAFSAKAYERLLNGEIPQQDLWKFSSFWYKDFDSMAKKTLIRQLIGKWGVMSAEMSQAMDSDNAVINVSDSGGSFAPVTVEEEQLIDEPTEEISVNADTEEVNEVDINDL